MSDERKARKRQAAERELCLPASDLKTVIVDAALAGVISAREAEDLISEYGLRHE